MTINETAQGRRAINDNQFLLLAAAIMEYRFGLNQIDRPFIRGRDAFVLSFGYEMGLDIKDILALDERDVSITKERNTVIVDVNKVIISGKGEKAPGRNSAVWRRALGLLA